MVWSNEATTTIDNMVSELDLPLIGHRVCEVNARFCLKTQYEATNDMQHQRMLKLHQGEIPDNIDNPCIRASIIDLNSLSLPLPTHIPSPILNQNSTPPPTHTHIKM